MTMIPLILYGNMLTFHLTMMMKFLSTHTPTTPEGLTGTGDKMVAAAEAHNATEEEEDAQQQRHKGGRRQRRRPLYTSGFLID